MHMEESGQFSPREANQPENAEGTPQVPEGSQPAAITLWRLFPPPGLSEPFPASSETQGEGDG